MVEKKGLESFLSLSAQVTCIFYDGYCSAVYPALEIWIIPKITKGVRLSEFLLL